MNGEGLIEALQVEIFYAAGWFRNYMHLVPNLMAMSGMASCKLLLLSLFVAYRLVFSPDVIPNFSASLHCMKLNRAPTGPV